MYPSVFAICNVRPRVKRRTLSRDTFTIGPPQFLCCTCTKLYVVCCCSATTCSPRKLFSDAGYRGVGRAVDRFVNGVHRPSVYTPLFTRGIEGLSNIRWARGKAQSTNIVSPGFRSHCNVKSVHAGSLAVWKKRPLRGACCSGML
jgi:hypothetical protein